MSVSPNRPTFEIELNAVGRGRIIKDGVDISNEVSGITIRSTIGELTELTVTYRAVNVAVVTPPVVDVTAVGSSERRYMETES